MAHNLYMNRIPLKNPPYPHPPGYKPVPEVLPPVVVQTGCVVYAEPQRPHTRLPRKPIPPREVECRKIPDSDYEFLSNRSMLSDIE